MKRAFTLAEVLITLGIIGVVAALTMPSLITKYQKKETAVRLAKAYSEISQAIKLSEINNDVVDNWDYSLKPQAFFDKYLKGYLETVNIMKSSEYIPLTSYKMLNGTPVTTAQTTYYPDSIGVILPSGAIMYIEDMEGEQFNPVTIDVNGFKPPNQFGKDAFLFNIQPKYGLTPYGFGAAYYDEWAGEDSNESFGTEYNRDVLLGDNGLACNKSQTGIWCAALIMSDGWEIKDDYPW